MANTLVLEATFFFTITLGICFWVVRSSAGVQLALAQFSDFLLSKAFPSTSDHEYIKFAFLRIIFGYLLLNRAVNIFVLLLPSEYFTAVGLWAIADIAAAICIMLGVFTQWTLLFQMSLLWQVGEAEVSTIALGNDISAIIGLISFLTGAGKHLSVDHFLVQRFKGLNAYLLYEEGIPGRRSIALAKFAALVCYFGICVFSLAVHLNERSWTTGVAGVMLFGNNYSVKQFDFFIDLMANNQWAVFFARNSLWVMMFWYPVVLPFVLMGGMFRAFVMYWGFVFLCFSSFVLQLGSVAEYEFVLWPALFWAKIGIDANKKLSVYYDDRIGFFNRMAWMIGQLDLFKRIILCPLAVSPIDTKPYEACTGIYGIKAGANQVYAGYDVYLHIAKSLFLLWPILPFLYSGKWIGAAPLVNSIIGNKGAQQSVDNSCLRQETNALTVAPAVLSRRVGVIALHVTMLSLFYFISVPAPYLGYHGLSNAGGTAAAFYGMTKINVFNRQDLRTAENWFTLRQSDEDTLVPLLDKNGGRMKFHRSDRITFGYTLRFRRGFIGADRCLFAEWRDKIDYLAKVYLHSKDAKSGRYSFEYVQYHQDLPDDGEILHNEYHIKPVTVKCTEHFEIDYYHE